MATQKKTATQTKRKGKAPAAGKKGGRKGTGSGERSVRSMPKEIKRERQSEANAADSEHNVARPRSSRPRGLGRSY